jgi:catechol 2,3-dioxygenase-like lactoylglutathione lyase family enzyme
MDFKYELTVVPVSEVDRAKEFYAEKLGFNVDVDHRAGEHFPRRPADAAGFGRLDHDRRRDAAGRARRL